MHATIYLHSDGYARVERSSTSGRVILDLSPAVPGGPDVTLFFDSPEAMSRWLADVSEQLTAIIDAVSVMTGA